MNAWLQIVRSWLLSYEEASVWETKNEGKNYIQYALFVWADAARFSCTRLAEL